MASKCEKCSDQNCSGGYQGGPEHRWRECDHVDTRPLIDKLESLLEDGFGISPEVKLKLREWINEERRDKTLPLAPGGIPLER
jgi:hypothetical protein